MPTFPDRVFAALGQFNGHLSAFEVAVRSSPADPRRLPRKSLDALLATSSRARAGSDAIARSFTLVERTALDIVDMQVRLQGETARLASSLHELGEAVDGQPVLRETFGDVLVALDEAAQLAASAVFPSAVKGLRDVNVKLWEFEKLQWKRYTDTLTTVVQRGDHHRGAADDHPGHCRRSGACVRRGQRVAQRARREPPVGCRGARSTAGPGAGTADGCPWAGRGTADARRLDVRADDQGGHEVRGRSGRAAEAHDDSGLPDPCSAGRLRRLHPPCSL